MTEWFVQNQKPVLEENLELSRCLMEYWKQHAQYLKRADTEKRNARYWMEEFTGWKVKDIRPANQREFLRKLVDKGYTKGTAESVFKTGAAAIRFAWRNDMLLNQLPLLSAAKELEKLGAGSVERWRAMDVEEIARLIEGAGTERLIRFIIILIGTGCRPGAALDLSGSQIDLDQGTIQLLVEGEKQTNKYRPVVRLPSFLRGIYHPENLVEQASVAGRNNKTRYDNLRRSWKTARKRAGLDDLVTPYSIRHSVAKWLRAHSVDAWSVSGQLGHRKKGAEITEVYASSDPGYLEHPLSSIEAMFDEILQLSPRAQKLVKEQRTTTSYSKTTITEK